MLCAASWASSLATAFQPDNEVMNISCTSVRANRCRCVYVDTNWAAVQVRTAVSAHPNELFVSSVRTLPHLVVTVGTAALHTVLPLAVSTTPSPLRAIRLLTIAIHTKVFQAMSSHRFSYKKSVSDSVFPKRSARPTLLFLSLIALLIFGVVYKP